jgi:hypothetical protein
MSDATIINGKAFAADLRGRVGDEVRKFRDYPSVPRPA